LVKAGSAGQVRRIGGGDGELGAALEVAPGVAKAEVSPPLRHLTRG
jgi:hypothetical protein